MSVKINAGYAWIDGYGYHLTDGLILDLETASGNMNRSDSIVIRLDLTNRWIKGFCKTGNYHSGNPTPPAPEISRTIHEIVLARIKVTAGTTEITQDMIEDTRMDKELCGWVCGAVEQIDFEQIYAQFQTYQQNKVDEIRKWIDQFQAEKEKEIKTWFDNLREQLTEDPAINLQEQIGKIAELTTENKDNLVAAINEVKTSIPIPIANMLATEEGNPLDAVIGKELKDLHDANAEEITKLNGKLSGVMQVINVGTNQINIPATAGTTIDAQVNVPDGYRLIEVFPRSTSNMVWLTCDCFKTGEKTCRFSIYNHHSQVLSGAAYGYAIVVKK